VKVIMNGFIWTQDLAARGNYTMADRTTRWGHTSK